MDTFNRPTILEFRHSFFQKLGMIAWLFIVLLAITPGCGKQESHKQLPDSIVVERPDPLTMLVVGDQELGAIIARQWSARQDGELTIVNQSSREFEATNFKIETSFDIVIYPPGLLGDLESQGAVQQLPKWLWNSDELNKNEFLRHFRTTLIRHGNETWAVPLGAPQFCLLYNADVFAKLNLTAPSDWDKLIELADKIQQSEGLQDDKGKQLPTKIDLPLMEGWAAQIFLARVGPMIRNRGKLSSVFERDTMEPLIADPPFVKGMQDLKSLLGPVPNRLDFDPMQIYQRVLAGESAIGFTWPSQGFAAQTKDENVVANVAIMPLPGSSQWYDQQSKKWGLRSSEDSNLVDLVGYAGLVASVVQTSRNTEAAFRFLEWLASKPINLITLVDSPNSGPFRASHLGDSARWTGKQISPQAIQQYTEIVRDTNEQTVVFMFPRIPSRQKYLAILDENVRACLQGKAEPEAALAEVAKQWNKLTDEIGRERQISELRKDAGL